MNCQQAHELIDLRVHGSPEVQECWAELDAHLKGCAHCRGEFEELVRVRDCLTSVAGDRPSDSEIEVMWTGIQNGGAVAVASGKPSGTAGAGILSRTSLIVRHPFVLSTLGAAAVLLLAFQIGNLHEGRSMFEGARRLVSAAHMKGIGTSGKIYAEDELADASGKSYFRRGTFSDVDAQVRAPDADDPNGWAVPAHPEQSGMGGKLAERKERSDNAPARKAKRPKESAEPGPTWDFAYSGGVPAGTPPPVAAPPPLPAGEVLGTLLEERDWAGGEVLYGLPMVHGAFSSLDHDPRKGNRDASDSGVLITMDGRREGIVAPSEQEQGEGPQPDPYRAVRLDFEAQAGGGQSVATLGEPPAPNPAQSSTPPSPRDHLKIIKTGELGLQVAAYEAAAEAVERILAQHGGFVADALSREEAGGALAGRIVVRVAPEKFEEAFAALKQVGRVESENVKSADVTAEYVDLEARIKGLQITEERLRELIANKSFVDKIQSLLEVEKEMNRVRTEIEQLQGQLRVMGDRVALSTIVVALREAPRNVPTASLSVEVATLDKAAEALGELLAASGGRLVSGKTSKRSDGTLMGNYQLETTLARFAETVRDIEALGRVEERQVKDQQFSQATEAWAKSVKCSLALVLFERSRQLPTGSLRIEVDNMDSAVERLQEMLGGHHAVIASNGTARQMDGSSVATLQLRVPAGRFAQLVDAMVQLGRTLGKSVAGEAGAIVGGAAAVPCEITLTLAEKPREVPGGSMTLEVAEFDAARKALSEAVAAKKAQVLSSSSSQRSDGTWTSQFRLGVPGKDMEAFVSQLEGLGRVAARQIHGLGLGDLSRIDPSALGTIDLVIAEKSAIAPAPDQSTATIRARVREGLSGFYESIGLIAYGLVVLFPWLLLTVLVGWLTLRIRARGRRRVEAQTA